MKKYLLLLLIAGYVFTSCKPAEKKFTDADKTAVADTVKQISDAMWKAFTNLDAEGGMSYWAQEATFLVRDTVFNSSVTITETLNKWFSYRASQKMNLHWEKTTALSPILATRIMYGDFSATFKKDSSTWSGRFGNTEIWSKESGSWKVIYLHQSIED